MNAEIKTITPEQRAKLDAPLPAEAVSQHPTKSFLSSIKSIYVTERMNDVFGVGAWRIASEVVDKADKGMIVVKVTFSVPAYGISYECYGGNNNGGEGSKNFDLGDAYKGAVTDAITKVGSWLGIGAAVFKGQQTHNRPASAPRSSQPSTAARPQQQSTAATPRPAAANSTAQSNPRSRITTRELDDQVTCDSLLAWAYKRWAGYNFVATFDAGALLVANYDADAAVVERFTALFQSYAQARKVNRR